MSGAMVSCRPIFNRNLFANEIGRALDVSKSELGTDYLTEKDFLDTIDSETSFCKVVTYNRQLGGFAICQIFGPDQVDGMLHLPDSPEKEELLSKKRIGLLDSIAIDHHLQNMGLGTELSIACYEEFKARKVDAICAMAWKRTDGTMMVKGILERMMLSPSIEIPGYWNQMVDSPEGHDCPVCGRPCKCSAVLYTRDL